MDSGLVLTDESEDAWSGTGWKGSAIIYSLSFGGVAVALAAVAWASGADAVFAAMVPASAIGHLISALPTKRKVRFGILIYPIVFATIWFMRAELLTVFLGGSLFPLARLLAVVQTLASFNLRSMRSLYDSFLLSLVLILLVSEGALSVEFGGFLLVYGVFALGFLASAYPVAEAQHMRLLGSARLVGLAAPVAVAMVLTAAAAVAVFLAIPQVHRVQNAAPLPSRLDLTIGRPVAPSGTDGGDSAPLAQFLPTIGNEARGEAGNGGGAAGDPQNGGPADGGLNGGSSGRGLDGYVTLGYTGEEEADVVMYVRSPLASYWRGQILDEYDGRGWKTRGGVDQIRVDRFGRLHFSDTPRRQEGAGRYVQSFFPRIAQPDSVFTGYTPGYIALQDPAEQGSLQQRAVENFQRLQDAANYRVVSSVPHLDPEALELDSVDRTYLFGRALIDAPSRVRELALAIIDGSTSDFQAAARLEQFLLTTYDYDLRVPTLSRSSDVVDSFLFERRAGYCAQFATAMAVMARLVGLPARVAVGYVPGEYNSLTGAHTVRFQDSHAWVEIKFRRHGWVPFDPTPRPDSPWALDPGFSGATESLQQVLRGQVKDLVMVGPGAAGDAISTLFSDGGAAAAGLGVAGVAAILALFISTMLRRRSGRIMREAGYSILQGTDRESVVKAYLKSVRILTRKGYPERDVHQSPGDYMDELERLGLAVPAPFRHLSVQASQALYDPSDLDSYAIEDGDKRLRAVKAVPKLA